MNFFRKAYFPVFLLLFSLAAPGGEKKGQSVPAIKEYDLNIPYKDEATGIVFPGRMGEFIKRYVRVNANEAIGNAIHYTTGSGISADVYLYLPERKKGEEFSVLLLRNYNFAKKLIFSMEQGKKREDMPEKEDVFFREETLSSPLPARIAFFTFTAGEESYRSVLFMTVVEKEKDFRLVKIRFSCPAELGKEGEKKWGFFRDRMISLFAPGKK